MLSNAIYQAWAKTPQPPALALFETAEYIYVQLLTGVAAGILFVINISSFIFYAVTALFGPLFIPLYMTDSFKGKFFHFIEVLLSFAMIRAVAAAFIFVWSGFWTTFLQQTFNGDYSIGIWMAHIIPVTMVFLAFIINMLFIPQMAQAIFGGGAGASGSALSFGIGIVSTVVSRGISRRQMQSSQANGQAGGAA